jgi:hypothetical protein
LRNLEISILKTKHVIGKFYGQFPMAFV